MGYRPRSLHNAHRKGTSCPECIRLLEIECGLSSGPKPPRTMRVLAGYDEAENEALINSIEVYLAQPNEFPET